MTAAEATYPYYADFLRPKQPLGPGFYVSPTQFESGLSLGQHLMAGTAEHVSEKLAALYDAIRFDRLQALVDWGGLPTAVVERSVSILGAEIAPALRAHAGSGRPETRKCA